MPLHHLGLGSLFQPIIREEPFEPSGFQDKLATPLLSGETPPMNRVEQRFATLKEQGRKGLVVYIGAGDPDLASTHALSLIHI